MRRTLSVSVLSLALLATPLLLSSCKGDLRGMRSRDAAEAARNETPPVDPVASQAQAQDRAVADQVGDLTARFHPLLGSRDENLVWSPLEAASGASVLLAASSGKTNRELLSTLRIHSLGTWSATFRTFRSRSADPALVSASRLWAAGGAGVNGAFAGEAQALAGARPASLPSDQGEARTMIADWVGGIAGEAVDVLPAGAPAAGTSLILSGATTLKAQPAGFAAVDSAPWHLANGKDLTTPMLHGAVAGWSAELPECSLVAVPLAGSRLRLVVAVPRTRDGLGSLEAGLSAERLNTWRRMLAPRQVALTLPRFAITGSVDLGGALGRLGAALPFGDQAIFGQLGPAEPGRLRLGLWRATASIAITGDDGASATDDGDAWPVTADRPFLFAVLDPATGAWPLLGRVVEPESPEDVGKWADQVGGS